MAVDYIPEGYNTLSPYLLVDDGAAALAFYKKAFGATERMCMAIPGGKIGHAELLIEGTVVMLADDCAEAVGRSPRALGGSAVFLHLYVKDVDAFAHGAVAAGANMVQSPEDKFYGDRSATLVDPFGHLWCVSTHVEDVSPEEMEKRAKAAHKQAVGAASH